MASSNTASLDKISLSADIVAAYVSRNSVTPDGLLALIESPRWSFQPVFHGSAMRHPQGRKRP